MLITRVMVNGDKMVIVISNENGHGYSNGHDDSYSNGNDYRNGHDDSNGNVNRHDNNSYSNSHDK
jgi:hypothetical protein